jgi:threonine dehydrogenase-like Zn-dependent dehydrogenase
MKNLIKIAVMIGKGQKTFEKRPIPVPNDEEVLVALESVGICGSDLHYYETGSIGTTCAKYQSCKEVNLVLEKEITTKAVFRYICPMAVEAVTSRRIKHEKAVPHIFDFDDIQNAKDSSNKK